jgi:hypothetical protein
MNEQQLKKYWELYQEDLKKNSNEATAHQYVANALSIKLDKDEILRHLEEPENKKAFDAWLMRQPILPSAPPLETSDLDVKAGFKVPAGPAPIPPPPEPHKTAVGTIVKVNFLSPQNIAIFKNYSASLNNQFIFTENTKDRNGNACAIFKPNHREQKPIYIYPDHLYTPIDDGEKLTSQDIQRLRAMADAVIQAIEKEIKVNPGADQKKLKSVWVEGPPAAQKILKEHYQSEGFEIINKSASSNKKPPQKPEKTVDNTPSIRPGKM